MEPKQQIVTKARDLFMRYGIKSISMDDLARELGMSKKTVYQYVENKADLIQKVFEDHLEEEKQVLAECRSEASNAIVKIARMVSRGREKFINLSGFANTVRPLKIPIDLCLYPITYLVTRCRTKG